MSMHINTATKELGQFASNRGYADLVEASKGDHTLKMFFDAGSADDAHVVAAVCKALRDLGEGDKVSAYVSETATDLADMIEGKELVYVTDGTHDGTEKAYGDDEEEAGDEAAMPEGAADDAESVDKFEIHGSVVKLADRPDHKHLVFGWFSIVAINGEVVTDTQGDQITSDTIESASYEFVLEYRAAGEMHEQNASGEIRGRGRLVESCVFTLEKQRAMVDSLHAQGIANATLDLGCVAWWGGFLIEDEGTWDKVVSGELRAFSVGGRGKRAAV